MYYNKIFIFIFLLNFFNGVSQKVQTNTSLGFSAKTKKVIIDNGWGERDVMSFDRKGRLEESLSNSTHGHVPFIAEDLYFKTVYHYNKKYLREIRNYYHDTLNQIRKYSYENDNLVYESSISIKSAGYKIDSEKTYCYERGKLLQQMEFQCNGNVYTTEYTYDDAIGLQIEQTFDHENKPFYQFQKTYLGKKFKVKEVWTHSYNDDYLVDSEKFFYGSRGNILRHTNNDYKQIDIYCYTNGIINQIEFYDTGELWLEKFYDGKGNIILAKRYDEFDDVVYRNYYNKRGDLILTEWFENDNLHRKTVEYQYWD